VDYLNGRVHIHYAEAGCNTYFLSNNAPFIEKISCREYLTLLIRGGWDDMTTPACSMWFQVCYKNFYRGEVDHPEDRGALWIADNT
jgi:hypothetical protein